MESMAGFFGPWLRWGAGVQGCNDEVQKTSTVRLFSNANSTGHMDMGHR